jgi:hypothetical protein
MCLKRKENRKLQLFESEGKWEAVIVLKGRKI